MSKKSFDELIEVQRVFGQLDFTLDSSGYSKWYATSNGSYCRLSPVFDSGMSLDQGYKLVGFKTDSQELIPIGDGASGVPWSKFPNECMSDLSTIIAELAPEVFVTKKKAEYIITAECSDCGTNVETFIHVRGTTQCFKCADIE